MGKIENYEIEYFQVGANWNTEQRIKKDSLEDAISYAKQFRNPMIYVRPSGYIIGNQAYSSKEVQFVYNDFRDRPITEIEKFLKRRIEEDRANSNDKNISM